MDLFLRDQQVLLRSSVISVSMLCGCLDLRLPLGRISRMSVTCIHGQVFASCSPQSLINYYSSLLATTSGIILFSVHNLSRIVISFISLFCSLIYDCYF